MESEIKPIIINAIPPRNIRSVGTASHKGILMKSPKEPFDRRVAACLGSPGASNTS